MDHVTRNTASCNLSAQPNDSHVDTERRASSADCSRVGGSALHSQTPSQHCLYAATPLPTASWRMLTSYLKLDRNCFRVTYHPTAQLSIRKQTTSYITNIDWLVIVNKWSCSTTRDEGAWGERRYSSYSFSTSALDGGEWSASRSGRALPPGKGPPVPMLQEAGWAPEPVWTQKLQEKPFRLCRGSNLESPVVQTVARH
jgi:hypothetical protein